MKLKSLFYQFFRLVEYFGTVEYSIEVYLWVRSPHVLAPCKGKCTKNVIFHDFFKLNLFLHVPRCYPTSVEMFV